MSKKKNQNEDTIKNFKKAISNFLSLLSEKKIPFLISVTSNILSTFLVVAIPWVSALAIDDIVSIMNDTTVTNKWAAVSSFNLCFKLFTRIFISYTWGTDSSIS